MYISIAETHTHTHTHTHAHTHRLLRAGACIGEGVGGPHTRSAQHHSTGTPTACSTRAWFGAAQTWAIVALECAARSDAPGVGRKPGVLAAAAPGSQSIGDGRSGQEGVGGRVMAVGTRGVARTVGSRRRSSAPS